MVFYFTAVYLPVLEFCLWYFTLLLYICLFSVLFVVFYFIAVYLPV